MHKLLRTLPLVALVAPLVAGCGGHSGRLGDGQWYGKLVSVDVAHQRLTFASACNLNESGRWMSVTGHNRAEVVVALAPHSELEIYFRPSGDAAAGHGQRADLAQLADVALRGRLPDFPPGWFVTLRDGAAVSVAEDSGIRSSGKADKRTFACVWSARTRAFVSN